MVGSSLEPISIALKPSQLDVFLRPSPVGVSPESLNFPWHRVEKPEGIRVTLASSLPKYRIVRLRVECDDERFKQKWVRWSYVKRNAREFEGGDALDAQDRLLDDAQTLILLLGPNNPREAHLEFAADLDGETPICEFDIRISVTEAEAPKGLDGSPLTSDAKVFFRHPRSRLMDMLPSLYAEAMQDLRLESEGEDPFFERFLCGFQDCYEPLQKTLDVLDRLFSPNTCPSDFLVWIGSWLTLVPNENWTEMHRRRLVKEAVELFRWRGTAKGLSRHIEVYTGVQPVIDDQPVEGWRLGPHAKLGTDQTVLGDVPTHTFVVTVPVPEGASVNEQIIRDIIRWQKPAHTAYSLNIVKRDK